MIKRAIQQKDVILANIYAPNKGALKYLKQILKDLKRNIGSNAVIADFNTLLTSMARSSRQKINKETVALNDTQRFN